MDPSFSQTPGKSFISIFCFLKNFKFGVLYSFNPLIANPIKWPNTLKQFVGNLPTNCLSVFGHFVDLVLKGLKPWKLSVKKLFCNEIVRCQLASLQRNSFIHPFSSILSSFPQNASRLLLPKRLWKFWMCASTILFSRK